MQDVEVITNIDTLKADYLRKRESRAWHEVELSRLASLLTKAGVEANVAEVEKLSARWLTLQKASRLEALAEIRASLAYNLALTGKTQAELTETAVKQEKNKVQMAQLAAEEQELTFKSQDLFQNLRDAKTATTRAQAELRAFTTIENEAIDKG